MFYTLFFLDLIGTVIPGALLIVGWITLFGSLTVPSMPTPPSSDLAVWILLALAYVLGHLVTGVGTWLLSLAGRFLPFMAPDRSYSKKIATTPVYKSFVQRATRRWPHLAAIPENEVHEWRNVAMSLLTPEDNHTVYRFMFISLLNLGTGTVIVVLLVAWLVATIAAQVSFLERWGSYLTPHRHALDWGVLATSLVAAYFFFERRSAFYPRALRVPFSMAVIRLDTSADTPTPASGTDAPLPDPSSGSRTLLSPQAGKMTVYLAGGMRSQWQDKVLTALKKTWVVIDPRTHHLADERAYTQWDLNGVRQSDCVLAYLEPTNPGGYNLAVEIGYAKALGKRIILVDGKSEADETVKRYTGMLRGCADLTPATLDEAIIFMQKLATPADNVQ